MADKKVGKVIHYYDKIGVAVVELAGPLAVGDTIKIEGHGRDFNQKVSSIQMEHEKVEKAKKGDSVGLKVDQEAKNGDEVTKIAA